MREVVFRLGALTGNEDALPEIVTWHQENLVEEIDDAVKSLYYTQAELSERLANAGILPMFGFPTRVRPLYDRWIDSRDELDKHTVSDRALDQAIANFSPGSEVTREGQIHTCVGFAAYEVRAGRAFPVDPLGQMVPLQRCSDPHCGYTDLAEDSAFAACPACGGSLNDVPLYQPLGFRTSYRARDYDDQAEGMGVVGFPQLAMRSGTGESDVVGGMLVERWPDPVRIIRLNDNRGELFDWLSAKIKPSSAPTRRSTAAPTTSTTVLLMKPKFHFIWTLLRLVRSDQQMWSASR